MGRFLVLSITTFMFMFVFQNCNSFDSQSVESLSSQCKAKLKSKVIAKGGWGSLECSRPSHYKCALKVYKPMIDNSSYEENECLDWDGFKICLDINVSAMDTSHLLDNPDISDDAFVDGGDFNRLEYRCVQTGIVEHGHPLIVGVGDSLSRAIASAKATCNQGVK